ncbi:MAG: dephospho-CoA kinase [Limnobacter sp.]|nr:dephospho-CoA kinase [Limnobacter sp.]
MSQTPLLVGLTGGIGSGKSQVSARLEQLGAAIVDTDLIAHAVTGPGGAALPCARKNNLSKSRVGFH